MTERCTLCGLEPNECARITDVTASGGMRRRLLDLGIAAGTRAECVSRGLFLASHHNHFINAALSDADIALAADIADDAFAVVAARHPDALKDIR